MSFPYINAYQQFFDSSGSPLVSGTIEFRDPTSNNLINSYPTADDAEAQTNANNNPLTLNASGAAASGIFLEDGVVYKVILKDANGATVATHDDVRCPIFSAESIGTGLYPQTTTESGQGVTPTNYQYPPGDIRRYGAGTDQAAATNDTAIANALLTNDLVIIPQDGDGSVYPISSSFTLGRHGQRVVGQATGNIIAGITDDSGPRLDVVTGFPTTGGDAAQAVFNLTSRNQRLENLGIDCNNIANIGVYGTGGLITRIKLLNLLIQDPADDGVKFFDSTFMNGFDSVIVASPGGWGFNFDATSGSTGHTTLSLINCYVTSATNGGFRFDSVLGFVMDACACDATTAFAVRMETGAHGVIGGMDTENTTRLFDLSENASELSRLTVNGCRFLQIGDNATPPANIIDNAGSLTIQNCNFQTIESATLFLETDGGSETRWFGNGVSLLDQTNSIHASSVVHADHWIHQSNTAAEGERLRIESASTPRIELYESGATADKRRVQLVVNGGKVQLQAINDSLSVLASNFQLDLANREISMPETVRFGDVIYLTEQTAAFADTPGQGQIWVKNTAPCQLWFTDDAGTDTQIV